LVPEPGVYVRLDWLRVTGQESMRESLVAICERHFGKHTRSSRGAMHFDTGVEWEPGVLLSHGHRCRVCMLDVRGERLRRLSESEAFALLDELMRGGFVATRLDGAIDWVGQDARLYERAVESCEAKQLCGARTYSPQPRLRTAGSAVSRLLTLGDRKSPIYGRIYDKGLEQRAAPVGYWERLEIEFKKDRAADLGRLLVNSGERWLDVLRDHVVGAIDFREVTSRGELDRRPRCSWWSQLIEDMTPRRLIPDTAPRCFNAWLEAFQVSYGRRILQMARAASRNPSDLVAEFLTSVTPSRGDSAVLREFLEVCAVRTNVGGAHR